MVVVAQFKSQPRLQSYQITNVFPHDPNAFTQGLEYDELCDSSSRNCTDVLWESTGDPMSGPPKRTSNIDSFNFLELNLNVLTLQPDTELPCNAIGY